MTKKNVEMYVGDKVYKSKSIKQDINSMNRDQLKELFASCESISSVVRDKLYEVSQTEEKSKVDKARPIAKAFIDRVKAISDKYHSFNSEITISIKNLPPAIFDVTFDVYPCWNGEEFDYGISFHSAKARDKKNLFMVEGLYSAFQDGEDLCDKGNDLAIAACPEIKTLLCKMKDIEKELGKLSNEALEIVDDEL